jgi:hypothetical protein
MTAFEPMEAIEALARRLPWRIRSVEWADPSLMVAGDDWSLTVSSSWRVTSPAGIAFSCSSADAEDRAWDLVGAQVVRIDRRGGGVVCDPIFVLSGDLALEVFSDTKLDSWVLRVGDSTVIVGPHC